jgi:hypothetical protein
VAVCARCAKSAVGRVVESASTIATPRHSCFAGGSSILLTSQELRHGFALALSLQPRRRGYAVHRSDYVDATAACDSIAAPFSDPGFVEPSLSRFDSADQPVFVFGRRNANSKTKLRLTLDMRDKAGLSKLVRGEDQLPRKTQVPCRPMRNRAGCHRPEERRRSEKSFHPKLEVKEVCEKEI